LVNHRIFYKTKIKCAKDFGFLQMGAGIPEEKYMVFFQKLRQFPKTTMFFSS